MERDSPISQDRKGITDDRQQQHRDCDQREHSCEGLRRFDVGLFQTEQKFVEQVKEQHLNNATIRRDDQFASCQVTQNDLEEAFDKGTLDFTAMPIDLIGLCRFPALAPVSRKSLAVRIFLLDQR
jgi:hypothetical protein